MSTVKVKSGKYILKFSDNGVDGYGYEVSVEGKDFPLYVTKKPVILIIKDYAAKHLEFDGGYTEVCQAENSAVAKGRICTPKGSEFVFEDVYIPHEKENTFLFERKVTVSRAAEDDLGFGSRVTLGIIEGNIEEYDYFAPGAWYKHNEMAPEHYIGHDMELPSYWYKETRFALPFFAVQSKKTGDTVVFSRAKADIKLSEPYEKHYDSRTDATYTYGSLGISSEKRISIDYVYPGTEGLNEKMTPYKDGCYSYQFGLRKRYHPVRNGFSQEYSLLWHFEKAESFQIMMKNTWRFFYDIFNPQIAKVDNNRLYHVSMDLLDDLCRQYYGSWGVPFKCLLPEGEIGIVDYQMGFIGQQPNIGYQLIRYGINEKRPETVKKGISVLDWWVENSMTEWGLPKTWYDPYNGEQWLDQPIWLRMLSDGMEGILEGYVFLKTIGDERKKWLEYCRTVGDWLVNSADADGSWCRAYNHDGTVRLESGANSSNVIRFLVQLYLVTEDERYKDTALKAGEWCYEHIYCNMEYVGGTCDNADVLDKESGIYALFGFLALYDLTEERKWLDAACGAADYTETWTYAWTFPVRPIEKVHAFHHVDMSGQSLIATGHSDADVYMAACSYVYYRLYLITGDEHYKRFAVFISKNPKQGTDLDGSFGYGRRGLCEESAGLYDFDSRGVYAWLPWVSYVQVEPIFRMLDTFGTYEIEEAEKLSWEERQTRNRIYDNF